MNPQITYAWLAEVILITYRSAKQASVGKNPIVSPLAPLPLPSEYVATFIIYGALAFVPGRGAQVASLVGWGIVAATLLNLWDPSTLGNKGGVAVKGGPSTKDSSGAPTVSPQGNPATGIPNPLIPNVNPDTGVLQIGG